jgi:hypothetical protein
MLLNLSFAQRKIAIGTKRFCYTQGRGRAVQSIEVDACNAVSEQITGLAQGILNSPVNHAVPGADILDQILRHPRSNAAANTVGSQLSRRCDRQQPGD